MAVNFSTMIKTDKELKKLHQQIKYENFIAVMKAFGSILPLTRLKMKIIQSPSDSYRV